MSTLPFVRSDMLPENFDYQASDGCDVAPACLACPLPQCRWDDPSVYSDEARAHRAAMVWRWRVNSALSVTAIARALKCSTRTVHRILQVGKPESSSAGPGPAEPVRDPAPIYKQRRPWPNLANAGGE